MTPEQRSAVRAGCNLATLPAAVREELEQEKEQARVRQKQAQAYANRIFTIRRDRSRAERELKQTGDLQPLVRAALNNLISGGRNRGTGN